MDARLWAHETGYFRNCYTFKRRPVKLEYCEEYEWVEDAINREKQIKGWSRAKKTALIQANVKDLSRLARNYKQFGKPTKEHGSASSP